uniref:Uncharacterized protein n=1 Tax=uncultured marine virus TaxID=186617 RepID=A0A0F7LA55_9VIRU|nr:hypothetical protein [uncultured marine virus]
MTPLRVTPHTQSPHRTRNRQWQLHHPPLWVRLVPTCETVSTSSIWPRIRQALSV